MWGLVAAGLAGLALGSSRGGGSRSKAGIQSTTTVANVNKNYQENKQLLEQLFAQTSETNVSPNIILASPESDTESIIRTTKSPDVTTGEDTLASTTTDTTTAEQQTEQKMKQEDRDISTPSQFLPGSVPTAVPETTEPIQAGFTANNIILFTIIGIIALIVAKKVK